MREKTMRRGTIFALALSVALTVFAPSTAAQAQEIPPPVMLDVPIVTQETPNWCWLAAAEMAIRHENSGMSLRQCEMLEIGFNMPPGECCRDMMSCAGPAYGMEELRSIVAQFGGVLTVLTPPLPPQVLYGALLSGSPVIARIRSGLTSSHVIVIRGMRFRLREETAADGTVTMGIEPLLLVNDPLSYFPHELPYERLLPLWIDSLIVDP
jgi:hypothetical protein